MNHKNNLSLEQEFSLKKISKQAQALSQQEAQELIVELQRQIMIKDNLYRQIIKQEWGI
ncbi:MAG: NblA/ycf18 family protein [Pleurocapsa sp.]